MQKNRHLKMLFIAAAIALGPLAHANNDVEGNVESVDASARTFTVQGITFTVDDRTDYDDGLRRFEDIKVGERVEVRFEYRDGKHVATEVERD